jgi:C-terminal processing protease CtpA/Prc
VAKNRRAQGRLAALESAGERLWKGKTVVLTDDATGSAAEVFAAALD